MPPQEAATTTRQVPGTPGNTVRILIADDDHVNRLILRAILTKEGYEVSVAENGEEAIDLYTAWQPDLVLMDIMMPVLDGYEATRRIKSLAGDRFIPVIFLTALSDEAALARCVSCGGDDFLTKPYSRVILKAKIEALDRARRMHVTLLAQRDELAGHQRRLLQEHQVAEKVLARIVHTGCMDAPQIKYMLSPMAIFNGDLLLAARKPSGGLHVILGDFTGHGLSAAIGTIPVADIFYGMTEKGFSIGDIIAQINDKLAVILPTDVFFAAALLELDAAHSKLTLWNGGCPEILVRHVSGAVSRLPSDHLPLGVVGNEQLNRSVQILEVEAGDRVYAYSDGFIEASNRAGEMFGSERMLQLIGTPPDADAVFDGLHGALGAFLDGLPLGDDLSLIEITCDPAWGAERASGQWVPTRPHEPMNWQISLELLPETLRTVDPLPLFMHLLMDLQGLYDHREPLYAVLMELFNNALDHGLLQLDSHLKNTPDGFTSYYELRKQRLACLDHGRIRITLEHRPLGASGRLSVVVEDDGPGFEPDAVLASLRENVGFFGRGIPLVRSICEHVDYSADGRHVEALYTWSPAPRADR